MERHGLSPPTDALAFAQTSGLKPDGDPGGGGRARLCMAVRSGGEMGPRDKPEDDSGGKFYPRVPPRPYPDAVPPMGTCLDRLDYVGSLLRPRSVMSEGGSADAVAGGLEK